jgi:hypothetical protein
MPGPNLGEHVGRLNHSLEHPGHLDPEPGPCSTHTVVVLMRWRPGCLSGLPSDDIKSPEVCYRYRSGGKRGDAGQPVVLAVQILNHRASKQDHQLLPGPVPDSWNRRVVRSDVAVPNVGVVQGNERWPLALHDLGQSYATDTWQATIDEGEQLAQQPQLSIAASWSLSSVGISESQASSFGLTSASA